MKKYLLCSLLATAVMLSGSVFAADGEAAPKKEKGPKMSQFTGEITAVDAAANSLSVKKDEDTKTFKAEGAKVATADKKDATLADLKVGDKVTVMYVEDSGAAVAKRIGPAKAPKAKKEKPAEKPAE